MSNNLNIKMLWLTMSLLILKTHLPYRSMKKEKRERKNE
jgi:hypothetical protein